jgi:hypothetical protein
MQIQAHPAPARVNRINCQGPDDQVCALEWEKRRASSLRLILIASNKPEEAFLRLVFSSRFQGMGWDARPPYGNRIILV